MTFSTPKHLQEFVACNNSNDESSSRHTSTTVMIRDPSSNKIAAGSAGFFKSSSSHTCSTYEECSESSSCADAKEESEEPVLAIVLSPFQKEPQSLLPQSLLPQHEEHFDCVARQVHFADLTEMHEIMNRLDYTPEEKLDCWYQKHEFAIIREEAQFVIDALEAGEQGIVDESLNSSRGLEGYLSPWANVSSVNYYMAVESVLKAQNCNPDDHKLIAREYRKVALRCRFHARMQAAQDQEFVKNLLPPGKLAYGNTSSNRCLRPSRQK